MLGVDIEKKTKEMSVLGLHLPMKEYLKRWLSSKTNIFTSQYETNMDAVPIGATMTGACAA